jgi:hypothetical protein
LLLSQFLVVIKPGGFGKDVFLPKKYCRGCLSTTSSSALVRWVVGMLHWMLADHAEFNQK